MYCSVLIGADKQKLSRSVMEFKVDLRKPHVQVVTTMHSHPEVSSEASQSV